MKDVREGFPDLLKPHSDDYDYSSDSDFEVDDEEVNPPIVREPQSAVEATDFDRDERSDIIHVEKEDTLSETSGVISASDMESTLSELDDIRCVHPHVDPSLSQHSQT